MQNKDNAQTLFIPKNNAATQTTESDTRDELLDGLTESTKRKELFTLLFLAGLVGLFANQASDKLHDVFQSLFKTTTREDMLRENAGKEKNLEISDNDTALFNDKDAKG